jgi:hypothetical protein
MMGDDVAHRPEGRTLAQGESIAFVVICRRAGSSKASTHFLIYTEPGASTVSDQAFVCEMNLAPTFQWKRWWRGVRWAMILRTYGNPRGTRPIA